MERILIADDEPICRRILIALLEEEYEVVEASNGREVIELLQSGPGDYKCLLLDIRMPEVDGFGVLDFMRQKGLLERIPVIALTAITETADQVNCYKAGVCDLLEKPYKQEILKCKIRLVIDKFSK